ncbi:UNVERIFIED_CONTAM: hypothetical protein FKN15_046841 [Acipenser sinensis]
MVLTIMSNTTNTAAKQKLLLKAFKHREAFKKVKTVHGLKRVLFLLHPLKSHVQKQMM